MKIIRKLNTKVITPSPRGKRKLGVSAWGAKATEGKFWVGVFFLLSLLFVASCSDEEQEYDPYYNWQARNTEWFMSAVDSARTAIADAKAQYGDDWEKHCDWRMYKSLQQSQSYNSGKVTDSICVHVLHHDTSAVSLSPMWNDTIRISYRGWLMPSTYKVYVNEQQKDSVRQEVFDQSYYGSFDAEKAIPRLSQVSPFVNGFHTALQYMIAGDNWLVYIPYQLGYGTTVHGTIPAYSTLLFQIHMAAVYPCGTGVPDWE